jgi:hypothetical protein
MPAPILTASRRGRPSNPPVTKRVQLNVSPPPSADNISVGAMEAPKSDRLGELLRMYSELSGDRKARAFDYVQKLHELERPHEYGKPPTAVSKFASLQKQPKQPLPRRRPLSSPPPPAGGGGQTFPEWTRPTALQVPTLSSYEDVGGGAPLLAPGMQVAPAPAAPPMELRVSLTADQLQRLTQTIAGPPADPLDGLVQSVFSPHAHAQQPGVANYATQPSPPQQQPWRSQSGPASPLRRQMRQPSFAPPTGGDNGGGESIYSMLQTGGGVAPIPPPPPPQPSHHVYGYGGGNVAMMSGANGGAMDRSMPIALPYAPLPAHAPQAPLSNARRLVGTPPPCVHSDASQPAFESAMEETRKLHDHLEYMHATEEMQQEAGMGGSPSGGGRRPFMQSLTSMHHSPTNAEAHYATRRRQEWLRDLSEQVRQRDEQRAAEKADKEIEDMKEEMRSRAVREHADQQLRDELARAAGGKSRGPN